MTKVLVYIEFVYRSLMLLLVSLIIIFNKKRFTNILKIMNDISFHSSLLFSPEEEKNEKKFDEKQTLREIKFLNDLWSSDLFFFFNFRTWKKESSRLIFRLWFLFGYSNYNFNFS